MSADKTLSWSYTEEFPGEDEQTAEARLRGIELGIAPRLLSHGRRPEDARGRRGGEVRGGGRHRHRGLGAVPARRNGFGRGADHHRVEPELQREAAQGLSTPRDIRERARGSSGGRASDVMPRMAARSYDMVVLDIDPEESIKLAGPALRMLRVGGVLAITRALWNDHVADPARRDPTTVAARELGKSLRDHDGLLVSLLPVGDGLLVAVRQA